MQRWPPITSLIDSSTRFRIALFATRRQHQHQQQPFPHRTARLETPLPAMHMQGHRTGPLSRITIPSNKDRDHDGNNVTHLHSSLSRHTFRSPSHSLHRPRFHSQLPRCTPTQQVQCQPRSFASQQTFGVDSTSINHDYNSSSYKYSSYYTPPQQDSGAAEKKQQEEAPLLKKKLKRFYLRVHPDLFEPFPREQAVNAENLAMLSNFFDEINGDRELGTTHLDLSFYIKVENTADADQTGKQGKTKAKERKEEGKERTRGVHYGNANEADARTVKASRLVQEAEFVEFSHSDGGKAGDHAHTKTNPDTNPWDNPPNPWEDDGDEEGDDDDGGVWRGGGRGGGKHIPHRKRATTSQRYSYHQQQQQHHHQQQQQQQQRITKTVGGDDDSTGPADRKKLEPQQKFELIRVSCSFKEPSQKERVRMMKQGSANIASYKLKIRHSMGQLLVCYYGGIEYVTMAVVVDALIFSFAHCFHQPLNHVRIHSLVYFAFCFPIRFFYAVLG